MRYDSRILKLRELIWRYGLTQADVAREMKIYPQRLSEILHPQHIVTDSEYRRVKEAIETLRRRTGGERKSRKARRM